MIALYPTATKLKINHLFGNVWHKKLGMFLYTLKCARGSVSNRESWEADTAITRKTVVILRMVSQCFLQGIAIRAPKLSFVVIVAFIFLLVFLFFLKKWTLKSKNVNICVHNRPFILCELKKKNDSYNVLYCVKCPYSELFWSVFFRIRTEYVVSLCIHSGCGKIRTRITPNTDTQCLFSAHRKIGIWHWQFIFKVFRKRN